MAYLVGFKTVKCLDCGGYSDGLVCPCGSRALMNVDRIIDREIVRQFASTVGFEHEGPMCGACPECRAAREDS